jgi:hypothetical protein
MSKQLLILLLLSLSGCSMNPVQPWQRDTLARPQMRPLHPVDTAFDDHIYFSKEASSGGQSFAGGGCGCN